MAACGSGGLATIFDTKQVHPATASNGVGSSRLRVRTRARLIRSLAGGGDVELDPAK